MNLNCCLADDAVGLEEGVYSYCSKHKEDDAGNDSADNFKPLHPNLVVPTYSLKHAPETVAKV